MDHYMMGGIPAGGLPPQSPAINTNRGTSRYGPPSSYGGGDMGISGPLDLQFNNLQQPSTPGGPSPNLGRRPTLGFGTGENGLGLNIMRRPSMDAFSLPTPKAEPAPPLPNASMEVGMPTNANPSAAKPVKSIFQQCIDMIETLYGFPLFEFYLFPDGVEMYQADPPAPIDPIAILWGCFRLGAPLCMLYNQLNPRQPLNVSDVSTIRPPKYTNVCKDNVYHFILACQNDLGIDKKQMFSISDVYKDDTNDFVKVMKIINMIVGRIDASGLLPPRRPLPFVIPSQDKTEGMKDNRSRLINELLDTERKYIHDLEQLQNYEKELLHQNVMSRDGAHNLFANLDELLDFQRRFLIGMERCLSLPQNEQRIGSLFVLNEENFKVYNDICANYQFATTFANDEKERLMRLSNLIPPHMLQSYLIKPVQRVCKYPLLLQELIKLSKDTDYPFMDELKAGLDSIKRVTERVNEQKRVEENRNTKNQLSEKVEDWKGLNPADFGELLLADQFPMSSNEVEREYMLYLFEKILLCCKAVDKAKKKSKKAGADKDAVVYSLKGNIYINSITAVQDTSEPEIGVFGIKVFWKDVTDMESFSLKCRNQEQVRLWKERLERQVELDRVQRRKPSVDSPVFSGLAYNNNGQFRGAGDELVDSAYAGSQYQPSVASLASRPSIDSTYSYQQAPNMQRSRSIPQNIYQPHQQMPPSPQPQPLPPGSSSVLPNTNQRRSQLAMTRGFSQADMQGPPPQ
ncbi:hypothetical protein HK101_011718, partial [Irineochytrium annulatum]